jgi:hypothetical protein
MLNTKQMLARLKRSCPTRCMTRWTNIFDIAAWIIRHRELLNTLFEDRSLYKLDILNSAEICQMCFDTMKIHAPTLAMLLIVFKILSLKLENNRTSASCIYGYEMSALAAFNALCAEFECMKQFQGEMFDAIHRRLGLLTCGLLQKVMFNIHPLGDRSTWQFKPRSQVV